MGCVFLRTWLTFWHSKLAWFGRINEFIHRSPQLPAARLPTFIYANFTITKGEELRGLFNKPVISDNISNGFHGSGGKKNRWIKGSDLSTSQPCFPPWRFQQNSSVCQTELIDVHNSQCSILKLNVWHCEYTGTQIIPKWFCWKCDLHSSKKRTNHRRCAFSS